MCVEYVVFTKPFSQHLTVPNMCCCAVWIVFDIILCVEVAFIDVVIPAKGVIMHMLVCHVCDFISPQVRKVIKVWLGF